MPFLGDMLVPRRVLLGGWTNPSEKYARQIGSSPQVSSKVLWIAKLLILPLLASFDKVFKPKCTWSLHSNDNGHPSLLQIHPFLAELFELTILFFAFFCNFSYHKCRSTVASHPCLYIRHWVLWTWLHGKISAKKLPCSKTRMSHLRTGLPEKKGH